MALSSYKYAIIAPRQEKILAQNAASKSAPMAKLWQFLEGHPKPAFFRKRGKGGPREIFQKSHKK